MRIAVRVSLRRSCFFLLTRHRPFRSRLEARLHLRVHEPPPRPGFQREDAQLRHRLAARPQDARLPRPARPPGRWLWQLGPARKFVSGDRHAYAAKARRAGD